MSKKKPVVALIYDFDGTLSPLNMQEYDFLKAIGIKNKSAFWKENNELIKEHEANNILCYMKLMIDKARAAKVSIKREQFVNFGKSIELYKGVEEWFRGDKNRKEVQTNLRLFFYVRRWGSCLACCCSGFHDKDPIPLYD